MTAPAYGANGRWGGRLASRPFPASDPSIDALGAPEEATRAALVEHWLGRAAAERRASDSFVVISRDLAEMKADPRLVDLATRAIDDELRHAEICRGVASRYAGRDVDAPARLTLEAPAHADAPEQLRPALRVLGQCALNETTATAYLEACLTRATGVVVRAALGELLSDDIDHARIGWAFLASLSPVTKTELARFVAPMIRAHVRYWCSTASSSSSAQLAAQLAAHGAIDAADVRDAVQISVDELIVPGLETLGLADDAVRALRSQTAPSEGT